MKSGKFYSILFLFFLALPVDCFSGEWAAMQAPVPQGTDLYAVWGSAADNVYAVGTKGTILHYDGNAWSSMNSPTASDLYGIWGQSANDIFAVGDAYHNDGTHYSTPTILRYDGTAWSKMPALSTRYFNAVWGRSADDIFASGAKGVMRFNGSCWSHNFHIIHV